MLTHSSAHRHAGGRRQGGATGRMRILVVEDEHRIATFLRRGLEQEHYTVDPCYDGTAAAEKMRSESYDLVVLDVLLPGRDGFELCREFRERGAKTPVLMLTARDAVADRVRGLDCGADDYLTKPFAFEELTARIRSLLRRTGASRQPQLAVGDLVLDPATHEVHRGGRLIELTSREYSLLAFLMRRAGHALSRTTILEHVWGYDFAPETNVVDVYVRYLRAKIDDGFTPPLLHTVRGVGYKLKA
jgi:DNA-binding response OmpR family regulator